MAFDAFFLSAVLTEIQEKTASARVEKIHQPSRDTVLLHLKCADSRQKLLFGINPTAPRLHLTAASPENPPEPPMFCMLLRKHLSGARLANISQIPMERCAEFTFDCIANANTQGFELEPETVLVRIFTATQAQFPLFDVMTDLIGGFLGAVVGGVALRIVLEVKVRKKKQETFVLTFSYATSIFKEETIAFYGRCMEQIIRSMIEEGNTPLGKLLLMSAEDQMQYVDLPNSEVTPFLNLPIQKIVKNKSLVMMDEPAIIFHGETYTYKWLEARAAADRAR